METQLHAKNKKKISNGLGCRTGTDVRTDVRMHESEFIGSFRSIKTSGEPKNIQTETANLKAVKIIIDK